MLLFYASLSPDFFSFYLCLSGCFYSGLLKFLLNNSTHHSICEGGLIVLLHVGGPFAELVYRCLALNISRPVTRCTNILLFPLV